MIYLIKQRFSGMTPARIAVTPAAGAVAFLCVIAYLV